MKASNTVLLVRLLSTYMRRRVLSQGPLRDPFFRLGIAAAAVFSLAALTLFAYLFLKPALAEAGNLEFLARIASISTVYWTVLAFLFVRVLFGRSSDMMTFTWQLPMTNQQRSAALAVFEALIILGVIGVVFIPVTLAVAILAGFPGLVLILEGVVFPAVSAFMTLLIFNNLLMRTVNALKLPRIAVLVSFVVCAAILGAFSTVAQPLATAMSDDFLNQRDGYHATDMFITIGSLYGHLTAVAAFAAIVAAAAFVAWLTVPHTYTAARKFFRIRFRPSWTARELGWYVTAWARRADTWLAIVATYALASVLLVQAPGNLGYAVGILTTQALYHFSATRTIRQLPGNAATAGRTLVLLLASQVIGLVVASLPVLAAALMTGTSIIQILLTLGGCISGVILLNLLGILFPQDRDNPFSAIVSYLVCLLIIATLVVVFGVVELPLAVIVVLLTAFHAAGLYYSYLGIQVSIRKARYA
ncbi:hypothetical protein ACLH0K_13865 [Arthrobacter sp. MPF02]|uniref:hypothetical protein n=1 Tax=Arthrobacter sp. MPF02 TaxID=3388492 RepID=UPI003984EB80